MFVKDVIKYRARELRLNTTLAENKLWSAIRRKQIYGIQFYRQKPLGRYIPDFYAPSIRLIIELDGRHHEEIEYQLLDNDRDESLRAMNITVLRFTNDELMQNENRVLGEIARVVKGLLWHVK